MSLNYKEINYLISLLKLDLLNSHINKITQINNSQLYINFRKNSNNFPVIFNIEQNFSFFGYGKPIISAPKNPYNFTQSLRKYLKGKKLLNIDSSNQERIFSFEFDNYHVIFELIDRNGNIFLIEKTTNKILSSLKNRKSKLRDEKIGAIYKPLQLKKQNKEFQIRDEIFTYNKNPLISVFCYYNLKKIEIIISTFENILKQKIEKTKKLINKLEKGYKESLDFQKYNNIGKAILTSQNIIFQKIKEFNNNINNSNKNSNKNKNNNNPKTTTFTIKIKDYTTNKDIELKIEKNSNPIEIANKYFNLAKKLKRKKSEIEKRKAEINTQLEQLQKKYNDLLKLFSELNIIKNEKLKDEDSFEKITFYFTEIYNKLYKLDIFKITQKNNKFLNKINFNWLGQTKDKKIKKQKTIQPNEKYHIFKLSSGKITLVGKSSKHNLEILKRFANGEDYWFHTRDFPGSYVIVKSKEINLTDIKEASNLAIYFSKARNNKKADIIYTKCKYLKVIKNSNGKVIYTKNKNYYVELDQQIINKLKIDN